MTFFSNIKIWLAAIAAAIVSAVGIFLAGFMKGKDEEQREQLEKAFGSAKDAKKRMEENRSSDDVAAKLDKLHKHG